MTEKVILDCDNSMGILLNEVDDGLTILYLLGVSEIELMGITTTFCNAPIGKVYTKTVQLANKLHLNLPIHKGESRKEQGYAFTPAAKFLVEKVNQFPNEISLLATGPLGNLYAATKLDTGFYQKVKRIAVMGGYLSPLKLGYRCLGEMNFSANPAASLDVLSAPCPITIFSAQACLDAPYRIKDIFQADYWPGWIKLTLLQWLLTFGLYTGELVFYLWDLLPAVFLTEPHLFNLQPFHLGSTLADLAQGILIRGHTASHPEVLVCSGIKDQTGFFNKLDETWRHACKIYSI